MQTKAALNWEEKDTYMVTVTATDPSGLSATVNVTIKVTDVDEPPVDHGWRPGDIGACRRELRRGQAGRRGNVHGHRAGVGQRLVDTGRRRCW